MCFCVQCIRFVVQEMHFVAANKGKVKVYLWQVFAGKKKMRGGRAKTEYNVILTVSNT